MKSLSSHLGGMAQCGAAGKELATFFNLADITVGPRFAPGSKSVTADVA
jgi:hypothetical protein